ncbi:LacI family DNA-binding transcriptional regulator [Pseudonocardia sp. C8]|uniref:LacI family DNA-binding transcriptional regulator n=1 Tax=Pseudonocardia sp. C8 TaxID=2762759 RepID=UPI001643608B|nr:LacI family DNA-binding transcriptional regulator [Pseudonocardia sp. C8]MBC3190422.1 LacI family DNA-binding transcriptional regulator [Pseudonocardia sp. C8]
MSDGAARPRVTIRDVATSAGVSISTVSHAFSGRRSISESTRVRVMTAAAELGYTADPSARSLRTGRSGLLGMILRPRDAAHGSHEGSETFTRFSGTVATEVLDHKLGLVHVPDLFDPTASQVPMDGCLVAFPYGSDPVLAELRRRDLPVVVVDDDPDLPDFPWTVRLDHGAAVRRLLDGFSDRGAERIWLLSGTEDNAWNRHARRAYAEWAESAGIPARILSLYEGEGRDGARALFESILATDGAPHGVIASASRSAAGVADAATALGLRIPDDLMVAALTDSAHVREYEPAITAVDLRLEELSRAAVQLLLSRLDGAPEPAAPVTLEPVLHWRASTAISGRP